MIKSPEKLFKSKKGCQNILPYDGGGYIYKTFRNKKTQKTYIEFMAKKVEFTPQRHRWPQGHAGGGFQLNRPPMDGTSHSSAPGPLSSAETC